VVDHSRHNATDYEFPPEWGLLSDAEKDQWYHEERAFRQASAQDFDRRAFLDGDAKTGTDQYRIDEDTDLE